MKIAPVVEAYDRIVREVKSDLVIVGAGEFVGGNKTPVVVKAIWDTGAYGSVISPKVASELGLTPVGVKPIQTANGSYEAYAYVVDIMLPNKLVIRGVEVSESDLKVCDALIGMDVISLGDMKVTNKPTTKFIFRIPAEGDNQEETGVMNEDYIAKRRAATKSFQDKVRALPEYAVAQAEVEQENALANLMIEARERAGFTQAQVAAKMGIGQSAFSRMERGNTTIKNFLRCLKICGYALKLVPEQRAAACL